MLLGQVIGTVWATRKDPGLVGMTFLIVREVDLDDLSKGGRKGDDDGEDVEKDEPAEAEA